MCIRDRITDYDTLLGNWAILRQYRNRAAHTENLNVFDFDNVLKTFKKINENNTIIGQLNNLKSSLKQ